MDLIKKLTGKNPSEYEPIAKSLVDNSDTELFSKLVKQDDFLFDFIKDNVAGRIQKACNKDNYKNLLGFLKYYSPSYDTMIAEVLNHFGGEDLRPTMAKLLLDGEDNEKTYAAKYFLFAGNYEEFLPQIRQYAKSDNASLSLNCIELLSAIQDNESKLEALAKLDSQDDFEQYEGVKFLVNYGAKDVLDKIIDVMKKSTLSENIASEIPYLIQLEDLVANDFESAMLVLCNIINSIPDIIPPSFAVDFGLFDILESIKSKNITSSSALVLALAKDKFEELNSNEEYLFDSDKNTKASVKEIGDLLKGISLQKLKSYFYDELYDESDFVFYALDYVDEVEELESLLDSKNQTLVLKVLTILKEKGMLKEAHKDSARAVVTGEELKALIDVL